MQSTPISIKENEDIKILIETLKKNKMSKQLPALIDTLEYVSTLENQFNEITNEIVKVKEQMANMQENPIKKAIRTSIQNIEIRINEAKNFFDNVKGALIDGAKQTIENFNQKGIFVLNEVFNFLHIKDSVKVIKDILGNVEKHLNKTIKELEQIEQKVQKSSVLSELNNKKGQVVTKKSDTINKNKEDKAIL